VRHRAILALGTRAASNAEDRRVLEQVASADRTPELRKLARKLLARG
jgi:hypothetical protein